MSGFLYVVEKCYRCARKAGGGALRGTPQRQSGWSFDPLTHFFSYLEVRDIFPGHIDRFATFWISLSTGWPVAQAKTPETANFNPFATGQCTTDGLHDFLDGLFRIFGDETGKAGFHRWSSLLKQIRTVVRRFYLTSDCRVG